MTHGFIQTDLFKATPTIYELYLDACEWVAENFFSDIVWVEKVLSPEYTKSITPELFLSNYAYVVLCSGFRNKTGEAAWLRMNEDTGGWHLDNFCNKSVGIVKALFLSYFNNESKVSAICGVGAWLYKDGIRVVPFAHFKNLMNDLNESTIHTLQRFPFIGPVTQYHLARNLGVDCIKPDIWLERIAKKYNYEDPFTMCNDLKTRFGAKLGMIDAVLWRYAEQGKIEFEPEKIDGRFKRAPITAD